MTDFIKRRKSAEVFGELTDDVTQKYRCHFCQKVICDTPECAALRARERADEWLRSIRGRSKHGKAKEAAAVPPKDPTPEADS